MILEDFPKMIRHLGRTLFGKAPTATPIDLLGKHVIVTGASPGSIGFETAKTLAAWGAIVTITTRSNPQATVNQLLNSTLSDAKHQKNAIIHGHTLDLTSTNSVHEFAHWYRTNVSERLDILINNAGIHLDLLSQWQQPQLTQDGFEIHWRTNYLGCAMLTDDLLPLLLQTGKKHGEARVINVSSHLHKKGLNSEFFSSQRPYNSWEAYGQSKLGIVHHAFELNRRFQQQYNVKGYALHPGAISTNIAGKGLEGNGILQRLRNFLAPIEALILLSPNEGAQTQIHCATDTTVEAGKYYERCDLGSLSPEASDAFASERLWEQTQQWLLEPKNSNPYLSNKTIDKKDKERVLS